MERAAEGGPTWLPDGRKTAFDARARRDRQIRTIST